MLDSSKVWEVKRVEQQQHHHRSPSLVPLPESSEKVLKTVRTIVGIVGIGCKLLLERETRPCRTGTCNVSTSDAAKRQDKRIVMTSQSDRHHFC